MSSCNKCFQHLLLNITRQIFIYLFVKKLLSFLIIFYLIIEWFNYIEFWIELLQ
jgi:hypothetical protein